LNGYGVKRCRSIAWCLQKCCMFCSQLLQRNQYWSFI